MLANTSMHYLCMVAGRVYYYVQGSLYLERTWMNEMMQYNNKLSNENPIFIYFKFNYIRVLINKKSMLYLERENHSLVV